MVCVVVRRNIVSGMLEVVTATCQLLTNLPQLADEVDINVQQQFHRCFTRLSVVEGTAASFIYKDDQEV